MPEKAKKRKSSLPVPHYVSYIDILGYSQKLKDKSPDDEVDFFRTIRLAFRDAKRVAQETKMDIPSGIEINLFSDNIVLSVPEDTENAFYFICRYSWAMQRSLLRHGLLCRGGISHGMFYQNPEYVFGSGLIAAYKLESSQAVYPRVILDRTLNNELKSSSETFMLFSQDNDGFYYLNYLTEHRQGITTEDDLEIAHDHYQLLNKELLEQKDPVVIQKLLWSVTYHNQTVLPYHEELSIPNSISRLHADPKEL